MAVSETVTGDSATGQATGGAEAQTAAQLLQALAQNQASMQSTYEGMVKSLTENLQKLQSISEDIAKKQDTNVDENMAGANGVGANDQVALARLVNNGSANAVQLAQIRAQAHFDSLQTILQLGIAGTMYNQNACQGFIAWNGHHQCGITANTN